MKNKIITLAFLLINMGLFAQTELDAIRYANFNPIGTARYTALGGAMGALGGDMTSISYNPAGLGVFRRNVITITPVWNSNEMKTNYLGTTNSDHKYKMQLGNIGFVSAVKSAYENDGIKFVNFGFSYNKLQNFNSKAFISGVNNTSSLLDEEVNLVRGGDDKNLFYKADLIFLDTVDNTIKNDFQLIDSYGATQSKQIITEGKADEYTFAVGFNFKDRIYVGGALSTVHVKYTEKSVYNETPNAELGSALNFFDLENMFTSKGWGMNLKVGVIARATNWLRLGLSLQTPTAIGFTENYSSKVTSNINYTTETVETISKIEPSVYSWELVTPFNANVSAAFVFKKMGFISVDYSVTDYSLITMESEDDMFYSENNRIKNICGFANNLKIGAEYNLGALSLRAGYSLLGSPYKSNNANKIAKTESYAAGVGINFGKMFFDLTGKYSKHKEYLYLYGTEDSKASINNKQFVYIATIGFKF